jgi:DNA-binding GntR family transcriptional regulator
MSLADSALETLRSASLASVLAQELERMVISGDLKPGERINEQQLAQRFGVSRGPIREAVRSLEGAGLANGVTNRGVFVRRLSVSEVRELYDIRAALFGLAGRLMAERATSPGFDNVDGAIASGSGAPPAMRGHQARSQAQLAHGLDAGAPCAQLPHLGVVRHPVVPLGPWLGRHHRRVVVEPNAVILVEVQHPYLARVRLPPPDGR